MGTRTDTESTSIGDVVEGETAPEEGEISKAGARSRGIQMLCRRTWVRKDTLEEGCIFV